MLFFWVGSGASAAAMGALQNLTINYMPPDWAVIDAQQPIFRWVIPVVNGSGQNGFIPTSYTLTVTAAQEDGAGVVWSSGTVASDATAAILPSNPPLLLPDRSYTWHVVATAAAPDNHASSTYSGTAVFHTGLGLGANGTQTLADWSGAEWISGAANVRSTRRNCLKGVWSGLPPPNPISPADPTGGSAAGHVVAATAFVASAGYHELYCGGVRQGDAAARLQPGFTNFEVQ